MENISCIQENGRFSVKRKSEALLRLLRGEDLELLSREYKITAGKLSQWRDAFMSGGQSGVGDDRGGVDRMSSPAARYCIKSENYEFCHRSICTPSALQWRLGRYVLVAEAMAARRRPLFDQDYTALCRASCSKRGRHLRVYKSSSIGVKTCPDLA